jgi:predicted HicB family RNase H-like nuclease
MRTTLRPAKAKRKPPDISNALAGRPARQHLKPQRQGEALSGQVSDRSHSKAPGESVNIDRYAFRVFWSPEDQEYVGACAEFAALSHLDSSPEKAFKGIRELVADVIADLGKNREPVPAPISERAYSGAFKVRIPPALHRRLVMEAAEEGVSLNRLVSAKLAS